MLGTNGFTGLAKNKSRRMTKPTIRHVCPKDRSRLRFFRKKDFGHWLSLDRTAKTLIRLTSLSLRCEHRLLGWFCSAAAHQYSDMGHSFTIYSIFISMFIYGYT